MKKVFLFWDSLKCFRQWRHNNLQGTKIDRFNIKSWKARVNKYIDKDVYTALTYLGFHLEHIVKKYIQMVSKAYCFLVRALHLLSRKLKVHRANSQTISSYLVRFSTDIVNSNIFFLLFLFDFFCFSIFFGFFCFFFVCMCVFFPFETKDMYSDTHLAMRAGKW